MQIIGPQQKAQKKQNKNRLSLLRQNFKDWITLTQLIKD